MVTAKTDVSQTVDSENEDILLGNEVRSIHNQANKSSSRITI